MKDAHMLAEHFSAYTQWRGDVASGIGELRKWLQQNEIGDAQSDLRLQYLLDRLREDKLIVAFVAEFSRGKSELINAVFFAGYGRRIMPASAGRTTMCPTEIGYETGLGICLRLLPISTRLDPRSLAEWRSEYQAWIRHDLNAADPEQMAKTLAMVSETNWVDVEEARGLGFWSDVQADDNPMLREDGRVEVPRWRHALINFAHPLLRQGLVILDTPGLNAVGAEPELTVSLIPQAHAVIFILGADTGVTRSDLAIWREHLAVEAQYENSRLVVLNKIDMLWDALSTSEEVQAQIDRQKNTVSQVLGVPAARVLAVSAQKGLVGKVNRDPVLLEASCLGELEVALAENVIGQRQAILQEALLRAVEELRDEASRMIHVRRRDLAEQMQELRGLEGKNGSIVKHIRNRVESERMEFEQGLTKIQAIRSVHMKLLRETFRKLSGKKLAAELESLLAVLQEPGFKLGLARHYADTFDRLQSGLNEVLTGVEDIRSMLEASFRQLNAEFSFTLAAPDPLEMRHFSRDLDLIRRNHAQYLSLGNSWRLANAETSAQLVRALRSRLRIVYESAQAELELWSKSATSQLEYQMAQRQRHFNRRRDAMTRVMRAELGLVERISEIETMQSALGMHEEKLIELCSALATTNIESPKTEDERGGLPLFGDSAYEGIDIPIDIPLESPDSVPAFLQEA